ncbi:serine/threonine-protein kinase bur1 [Venturia nashicola]|uniref:Serine/threonine-protein kinase BUR1 n=1 Tax=Venturia nashicola TaxID=86259 RepID=A0A4Z1NYC0_9PEZI|nr:serine/threonine-protein kinase bur1 [Venturia nashicola]TLD30259.1 serine/threonine-protein kinase bur1 [Venturia nashicola]
MTTPSHSAMPTRPLDRRYHGSAKLEEYDVQEKLGEGTFGEVYRARSRRTNNVVALKKILMHNEKDGFPITALREIKLLKMLSHINVIRLEEMIVDRTAATNKKRATLYMVTPYMAHDLSGLLDNQDVHLQPQHIKCYMLQLLRGLKYLHNSHILHRDMKAANLLISGDGILKIADFGLARHYDDEVPKPGHGGGEARREYTTLVVTRWYRPPELLLQLRKYTTAIDMWGAGCVFGEMFKKKPILAGKSDLNQAQIIFELVGSPTEHTMPGWQELPGCEGVKNWVAEPGNLDREFGRYGNDAVSLMRELLRLDYRKRINAMDALHHPYFTNHPLPSRPEDIPWFADSHELDKRNGRPPAQNLPPAPQGGAVGGGPHEWSGNGPPTNGWDSGRGGQRGGPRHNGHGYNSRIPQGAYDVRGVQPGYDSRGPRGDRRQPWANGESSRDSGAPRHLPQPPEGIRHALPPRPDVSVPSLVPPRERDREPRDRGGDRDRGHHDRRAPGPSSGGNLDSYVPAYRSEGRRGSRDDRRSEGRDDRYREERRPAVEERRGGREEFRDWDAPRTERREHRRWTRSRSPDGERDRDGERRDRDREAYRR